MSHPAEPARHYIHRPLGLYRTVLDLATFERIIGSPEAVAPPITASAAGGAHFHFGHMHPRTAVTPLAMHVAAALRWRLEGLARDRPAPAPGPSDGRPAGRVSDRDLERERLRRQVDLVNRMLDLVRADAMHEEGARAHAERDGGTDGAGAKAAGLESVAADPRLDPITTRELLAVAPDAESIPRRPDTPLDQHWLLAAGPADPSLQSQLALELASADHVDIICSFVKFSGVRLLLPQLEAFCARPSLGRPRLRLLTTTYMGATDLKAVVRLARLPNTEVRVSFDGAQTRLHAKAYMFRRASGFGSAYVGSANLSKAALTEGHEWVVKIAQASSPDLWDRIEATYEGFWESQSFDRFDPGDPEAVERLRRALERESTDGAGPGSSDEVHLPGFELRPYPFQREVLDRIAAEREALGRDRHLVVAATGTGKTMIAAFDYRSRCRAAEAAGEPWPRLLFVAHQDRILKQALATFRHVLRDFNFGALLVGGHDGSGSPHLFASIQSIGSTGLLERIDPGEFAYVVIDEAHHGEARTYRALIDVIRPRTLLGLTATPERADGRDIFQHFGHRPTAEVRLPDAIERRLLSPFQYFVISDESVDLTDVAFRGGTFDRRQLEQRFIGNEIRSTLVLEKIQEVCVRPDSIRGLGFCTSVAHAEFMADRFRSYGFPSACVTGSTPKDEVAAEIRRLQRGEIRVIFTVDLFNEGVDIPEVDTVLLLRPTESLTVFLQQLGRGLRVADGKECLTVLDFVSQVSRNYRFETRFRALLSRSGASLESEIQRSFPSVPAGCAIRMERVAQEVILANVRYHQRGGMTRLAADLQWLRDELGRVPSFGEFLDAFGRRPEDLYRRCTWTELLHRTGLGPAPSDPDAVAAASPGKASAGLMRLAHVDDVLRLDDAARLLDTLDRGAVATDPTGGDEARRRAMLHRSLWPRSWRPTDAEARTRLSSHPELRRELRNLFSYNRERIDSPNPPLGIQGPCALQVHAHYTRDEIMLGLGIGSLEDPKESREGVHFDRPHDRYLMFVTLTKTEDRFSPTTMYHDYAISEELFHWQSQSTTSDSSPTGRMLVEHRRMGVQLLLFVRDHGKVDGYTMPFMFLGTARTVAHTGSRPMNLTFRLTTPMPAVLYRYARRA